MFGRFAFVAGMVVAMTGLSGCAAQAESDEAASSDSALSRQYAVRMVVPGVACSYAAEWNGLSAWVDRKPSGTTTSVATCTPTANLSKATRDTLAAQLGRVDAHVVEVRMNIAEADLAKSVVFVRSLSISTCRSWKVPSFIVSDAAGIDGLAVAASCGAVEGATGAGSTGLLLELVQKAR